MVLLLFLMIPSIFSDNMVLQQNTEVNFWGKATPGKEVVIQGSWGASVNTVVNDDSTWQVKLKTVEAGGPYEVSITIDDSIVNYKNVMLGEVWLCSGQSNMEMTLAGWPPQDTILNSEQEIKNADYPHIRLFNVSRTVSNKPEFDCSGEWLECNPQNAANFSATAFFFGRKLYEELNVPIGLITSSVGGTPIEAWMSGDYISKIDEYKSIVKQIKNSEGEFKKLNKWIRSHPVIDINRSSADISWKKIDLNDSKVHTVDFNDSAWKNMELPQLWESTEVGDFDGVVWFRKQVKIPESFLNKDLTLELGPIDDMDITFVNGTEVGGYIEEGFWQTERIYKIPASIVYDSLLTIAVKVIDNQGGGGIYGNADDMKIYSVDRSDSLSIAGSWKYLPVAEYAGSKLYVYGADGEEAYERPETSIDISQNTPTMLYNGMIAPLVPYNIKGTIWYQGEANTGNPEMYKKLFPLMIENWRDKWDLGQFPFYYVQLAPWAYGDDTESQAVREVQFQTLSVPNTGIAVTLDIGSVETIHPSNKQDVGRRLALWALAKDYGKDIVYSGPLYKSMEIDGSKIILSFDHVNGGLQIKKINGKTNFIIAGPDKNFVDADVLIEEDKLIVYSEEVENPVAVRYTWGNTMEATFFNEAGLPAPTFKTDSWAK